MSTYNLWLPISLLLFSSFCNGQTSIEKCGNIETLTDQEAINVLGIDPLEYAKYSKIELQRTKKESKACKELLAESAGVELEDFQEWRVINMFSLPILTNDNICKLSRTEHSGLNENWDKPKYTTTEKYSYLLGTKTESCSEFEFGLYVLLGIDLPDKVLLNLLVNAQKIISEFATTQNVNLSELRLKEIGIQKASNEQSYYCYIIEEFGRPGTHRILVDWEIEEPTTIVEFF